MNQDLSRVAWKKRAGLYVASCPHHIDHTPSLTLYPDGHAFCYSCHRRWINVTTDGKDFEYNPTENVNTPISPLLIDHWHGLLSTCDEESWFIQRGFTEETIESEKWGYDPSMMRYVITVWDGAPSASNVVQVRLRKSAQCDSDLKYIGMAGHNYAELYNRHILTNTNWACMFFGELDARLATQYGFPSVSPTNGKGTFRIEWLSYFDKIEKLYIIPDANEEVDAYKLSRYFSGRAVVRTLPPKVKGSPVKDFNDFILHGGTSEQFDDVLKAKRLFNVIPYWTLKDEN